MGAPLCGKRLGPKGLNEWGRGDWAVPREVGSVRRREQGRGGILLKNRALVRISSYTVWGDPGATGMVLG